MVVNPKASHNFAKVLMKNSKTDAVDAETLAQYAERMDFVAWTRPSDEKIALRCFPVALTNGPAKKPPPKTSYTLWPLLRKPRKRYCAMSSWASPAWRNALLV